MCNRTTAVLICEKKIVYNVKKMMKRVSVCVHVYVSVVSLSECSGVVSESSV